MKIISKFHDYYDSALQFGQDEGGVVFVRHQETSTLPEKSPLRRLANVFEFSDWAKRFVCGGTDLFGKSGNLKRFVWSTKILWFCGKGYPLIRLSIYHPDKFPSEEVSYHYSNKSLPTCVYDKDWPSTSYRIRNRSKVLSEKVTPDPSQKEFLIENKIALALVEQSYLGMDGPVITLNPSLKEIEFFKVMDPFQCHQEIDMFLGGVLANNPTVGPIPDKFKIQQHGFDKMSFRKYPEKDKRK